MKFQGNPKDYGGSAPPPPVTREATTPPSSPRKVGYPNIPRRHPQKPTHSPRAAKRIGRLARLAQQSIDGAQESSDLMVPALELLAGMHPLGRAALLARDVWGYFGPQEPETPARMDYPSSMTAYDCCDLGPPYTHVTTQSVGSTTGPYCSQSSFNQCGLGNQAVTNPTAYGDALPMGLGQSQAVRYWQVNELGTRYTLKKIQQVIKPRVVVEVPFLPPQPGRQTVQPVPATVTPPLPATVEPQPQPSRTKWPDPIVEGFVKPRPANPNRPSEIPANTVEVVPGGTRVPPQNPHVQAPHDGPELKIRVNKLSPVYRAIADVYNGATEADDFIQILAEAIEGNTCKGLRPVEAAICVGQNFHKLNLDKFMEGLIANHIEDQLVGAFLSWGKKSPYGVQMPTNGHRLRPPSLKGNPRVLNI